MTRTPSRFIGCFLALLLSASAAFSQNWRTRGVCWDANWEDKTGWYGTPQAEEQLKKLQLMGVNALSLSAFVYQSDVNKPGLSQTRDFHPGLRKDAMLAKEMGFSLIFKPVIWSNQFWEGESRHTIAMKNETEWAEWFSNYRRALLHFADQAEDIHADVLVVGVEYENATRGHDREWRDIIREVREHFHGRLTYAAHGLNEVQSITFWNALDVIGINFYEPVATTSQPTREELAASWKQYRTTLADIYQRWGKKILFTEIGYANADGTAANPEQSWDKGTPADEEEQDMCYRAMFASLTDAPGVEGLLVWKYKISVTPVEESREPSEWYSVFQDRPAQAAVERAFQSNRTLLSP